MAKRPIQRRHYALNADSAVAVTVKQAMIVAAVVLAAGAGYGTIVWNQSSQSNEIKSIQASTREQDERRERMAKEFLQLTREQDERRAALAKEFLASNREIATKVNDLTTAIAVQQATQKATSDALAKISDQLGTIGRQLPEKR